MPKPKKERFVRFPPPAVLLTALIWQLPTIGLATSAAAAGKSERVIMKQTRHRSVTQVRKYIRDGEAFTDNAVDGLL